MSVSVLFVCLGNICRSPTAHGLFQHKVNQIGLSDHIVVDSAGTGGWHSGAAPDERSQSTALERGYDISHLSARKVVGDDFTQFDYILAMDQDNLSHLSTLKPASYQGILGLFLDVAGTASNQEVPDPYYGDQGQFQMAIKLIEDGSDSLLARIRQEYDI
jgi:protein-tyrosine phosphatase